MLRPNEGTTARTSKMMPKPPSHCERLRHSSSEGGKASTSARIVAPVVVSPEKDSKTASVNEMEKWISNTDPPYLTPASRNGRAPKRHMTTHIRVTVMKELRRSALSVPR